MSVRRLSVVCCTLLVLFAVVLCRVYWVGTETAYAANAGSQTVCETELPVKRGNFTDRNGRLLTGAAKRWYALCIPGDSSYSTLFPYVSYASQTLLYERRNTSSPFLVETERDLSALGIFTCEDAAWSLQTPIAVHLLGYLDGEGHGVTGLEKAFDSILSVSGDRQAVRCRTTARGALQAGSQPEIITLEQGTGQGVQLTLDADIQRLCEGIAAQDMPRGCILVMDTATGQLLASVSMPAYDVDRVADSIRANDTSFINRAFSAFSAGSVFKVVLAAAAYENGLDWFSSDCTGSVEVAGLTYRCALGRAHGEVNLRGALAQSCNCYFVELGQLLGGQAILQTAQEFGFGTACTAAPGLVSAAGIMPDEEDLENPGQLAVVSFGQGALTATPLQITAMMNTVANGGEYQTPRFVLGVTDAAGTILEPYRTREPHRACSADVARVLRSMLCTVVEEGIGGDAAPEEGGAGGKTGTAQTGQFTAEGEELLNYWFSGFYPAEQPRYTITVLQDGVLEPATSSAAIFARITNALHVLENSY